MTELAEERQALDRDWAKLEESWAELTKQRKNLIAFIRTEAQNLAERMLEKKLIEVKDWLEKAQGQPDIHLTIDAPISVNIPPDMVRPEMQVTVEPTIPVEVKPVLPVNVKVETPSVPIMETETIVTRNDAGLITSTKKTTGPAGTVRRRQPTFDDLIY